MTANGLLQIALFLLAVLVLVKPLGWYMAMVYQGKPCGLNTIINPFERFIYKLCGIQVDKEMSWKKYLSAMLLFNLFGLLLVYAIQRFQFYLPFNPQGFTGIAPDLSFNNASSFTTNTDWQNYGGESTLSYSTQMLALTVQNFLSAATGTSLVIALIRGLSRLESKYLGNFWVDTVRSTLYIYLPLSFIFAIFLASQGVIQNFKPYQEVNLLQTQVVTDTQSTTKQIITQTLPMGPVASQVAIKQLGTNGGGFFNTNSAHPFENPTALTNFFELLAILLIPAALCYTMGAMINDKRQGWSILVAMFLLFTPMIFITVTAEQVGNPAFQQMGIDQTTKNDSYAGGNMEGKEARFGIVNSALWATATTATSNGSVNSMHDSYTPLGGLVLLWMMHLGEVAFGGVGSGLYGMLMLVIITVFIGGLTVGRTPEYLGKKIEPYEMKMASVAVLLMPTIVLLLTAIAALTQAGLSSIANPGPHGFSEILYAFTSMGNNNGSAFAGLNGNTPFYNLIGGIEMLILRFWIAIPVLAVAGSLINKRVVPSSLGTLPTHVPLFILMLLGVTIIVSALSFLPALALGPIAEQLTLWSQYVR